MTTGHITGQANSNKLVNEARAFNQACRNALAGHEIDAYPDHINDLARDLWLCEWYLRPVPEGESTDYWVNAPHYRRTKEEETRWRERSLEPDIVNARNQLIKTVFASLSPRQQLALALFYGLIEGTRSTKAGVAQRIRVGPNDVRVVIL